MDILSQSEIDALLGMMTGETKPPSGNEMDYVIKILNHKLNNLISDRRKAEQEYNKQIKELDTNIAALRKAVSILTGDIKGQKVTKSPIKKTKPSKKESTGMDDLEEQLSALGIFGEEETLIEAEKRRKGSPPDFSDHDDGDIFAALGFKDDNEKDTLDYQLELLLKAD